MNTIESNRTAPVDSPGVERSKRIAVLASLLMVGAVLWPVQQNWRETPKDSFPLSYYPMFTAKRRPVETFYYLVGYDGAGNRFYLPHTFAGDGGHNAVRRQVNKTIREGRAEELAQKVAGRLAERKTGKWSRIVSVDVMKGRFSVDDYFHGKKDPVSEVIQASRVVERSQI
jgi:hypothetical protein